jgi:tripartite-type tricarboxylate transporter receptor subunit TctC
MRRHLIHAAPLLLAALCGPGAALAQSYPAKPVRVVIVFPAGGSNDVTGRIVFGKLSEMTGQRYVLENRGGAGGTIGSELVAKSPPDGYTVMVQSTTHVVNAHLYKKLPYDTRKDFIGVSTLARQVGVLVVHPSMPVRSVRELIALAKRRPGQIAYAGAGNGSYAHMAMALFVSMSGTNMLNVQYKGAGPGNIALIAGETQAMLTTLGSIAPHIRAGQVRALGVSSDKRTTQFPEIPAIAETVPGFDFIGWVGCFVPAGTPREIVEALNASIKRTLDNPEVAKRLADLTLDPLYMTPEQFAQRLQSDYDKYAEVVRISGARIE